MTALLANEARHLGSVLASVWRACGRAGWVGAGLLGALLAVLAALAAAPQGVGWLPSAGLRRVLLFVCPSVSALVIVAFWMRLVVNVLQQNDPQLARLLPGQVRALRAALCGLAVSVGLTAALISVSFGGPLLAVLAGVLATLTGMAAVLRWPLSGFALMALSWSAPLLGPTAAAQLALRWMQGHPGVAAGAAVAMSLMLLGSVVMGGGLRHVAAHRRVRALAGVFKGDLSAQAALRKGESQAIGNPGLLLGRGLYGRWLRWLLRRPASGLLRRLALGLGPQLHWTGLLSGLLVAGLFVLVPLLLAGYSPQAHAVRAMGQSMVTAAPLMMLAAAIGWPPALWASRREQALLRLLPGAPQGAALNRWLARHIARQYLSVVALTTAISVVCIRRYGLDFQWAPVEDYIWLCAALSPWLLLGLWRNWSAMRAPTGGMQLGVLAAVLGIGATAWAWVGQLQGHWWTLAGLSTLLFLPLALWRWRVAVQAPVAWPVGWASEGGAASVAA
jgi:hypothetical protein